MVKLGFCFISTSSTCAAFQLRTTQQDRSHKNLHNNHIYFRLASDNNSNDDGRDLAVQFSEELKKRNSTTQSLEAEAYEMTDYAPAPKPIRKFTGASPSLFTNNNRNVESSNIQRERQREFNLASRFERAFPIQAAILLAWAIFITLIGSSGGFTDGSDRYFYGDDDLIEDAVVEQLERIRTDDAAEVRGSYWL